MQLPILGGELKIPEIIEKLNKWKNIGIVGEIDIENSNVPKQLVDNIKDIEFFLPVVTCIQNPNIFSRPEYQEELRQILGLDIDLQNKNVTLKLIMELDIADKINQIIEMNFKASEEQKLRDIYNQVVSDYMSHKIPIAKYQTKQQNDKGAVERYYIPESEFKEEYAFIDENILKLKKILLNPYSKPVKVETGKMMHNLSRYLSFIKDFSTFQKFFGLAENLLSASSSEVSKDNAVEMKRFGTIENLLKSISKCLKDNSMVQKFVELNIDKMIENVQLCLGHYEVIFKGVEEFLENRKKENAKFYSLSNEELLDVFMNSSITEIIRKYISKLVLGTKSLEDTDNEEIFKLISDEKEVFTLKIPKSKQVTVKEVLETIEGEISKKIGQNFRLCIKELKLVKNDIQKGKEIAGEIVKNKDYLSQSIFTVLYAMFSENIEKSLKDDEPFDKLMEIKQESKERKKNLFRLLKENSMTEVERKKAINLICCENYFTEVIKYLIREEINSPADYNWTKYIYMNIDGEDCNIRHMNYNNVYGYQLVGVFNNFILSPQTERIFITMTNNFQVKRPMYFYGFDNSGKKETIIMLSKLFGYSNVIFHMSEYFDLKSFKHLYNGAAKSGNWLIINNFNSLTMETLSVVSQEIMTFYQYLLDLKIDSNSNSSEAKLQIIKKNMQIFCLSGDIKYNDIRKLRIKNYFRLVGLIAPDLLFIIATTLRNYKVPDYKIYSRKIKLVLEYYNNKIALIERERIEIKLFNNFLKIFRSNLIAQYPDSFEVLIRNCLCQTLLPMLNIGEADILQKYLNMIFNIIPEKVENEKDSEEIVEAVKDLMTKYNYNNKQYRNKIISVTNLNKLFRSLKLSIMQISLYS